MISVKIYFKAQDGSDDIRRISLNETTTWQQVTDQIKGLFAIDSVSLQYVDSEGDKVSMDMVEEWRECLRQHGQGTALRLYASAARTVVYTPTCTRTTTATDTQPVPVADQTKTEPPTAKHQVFYQGNVLDCFKELLPPHLRDTWPECDHEQVPGWLRQAYTVTDNSGVCCFSLDGAYLHEAIDKNAVAMATEHQYAEALAFFNVQAKLPPSANYDPGTVQFNQACCHAQLHNMEEGVKCLQESINAGFNNLGVADADEDLAPLRSSPQWPALRQQIANLAAGKPANEQPEEVTDEIQSVSSESTVDVGDEIAAVEEPAEPDTPTNPAYAEAIRIATQAASKALNALAPSEDGTTAAQPTVVAPPTPRDPNCEKEAVLVTMGFDITSVQAALRATDYQMDAAVEKLIAAAATPRPGN
eukprot:TRINITY_DN67212_c0_g1_i1.p2 TRINITY_DN67212_c0_g1~~TRINITY_DN67212_c0_g1_i1.p2  ORF type:complete len:417 (-),score=56.27 TRINITY_DN67212_c0_g1_i1:1781-3031(-)